MSAGLPEEEFQTEQVCRMLGITERQLRRWQQQGTIPAGDRFRFPEIVVLKSLIKLRAAKVRNDRVRKALAALREKLGDGTDALTDVRIFAENGKITVSIGGARMEPVSGQLLLNFDQEELSKLRTFPAGPGQAEERRQVEARLREAQEWFERGVDLERRGAPFEDIASAYHKALDLDEKSVTTLVNLGTVYFQAGKWKEAEDFYKRALELEPDYALAHFNLGNVYDEMGEFGKAGKHYTAALRVNSNYADAHYNLALNYQNRGQLLMAVRHWREYLKLDQASEWATIARRELAKLSKEAVVSGNGGQSKPRTFGVVR